MGRKTKKFIDKKNAATFQLLARDSAEDTAGGSSPGDDRVFVRVDNSSYPVDSFFPDQETTADGDNSIFADASGDVDDDDDNDDYYSGRGISVPGNYGVRTSEGKLPEHVRKEILELGFPDDGYNYLIHLREIKNAGGGSAFYHNTKARLDLVPKDVKAYDASRVNVPKTMDDSACAENSVYNVAKNAVNLRAQKVFDPEVAALLDDSDLSRFGSDVEDLDEDFVIQANLPGDQEDVDEKLNSLRINEMTERFLNMGDAASLDQGRSIGCSYVKEVRDHKVELNDECFNEKPRVRRLLDEQFDMLERQEYGSGEDDYVDNDYYGHGYEEEECLAEKLKQTLNDNVIEDLEPEDGYKAPADLLRENDSLGSNKLQDSTTDLIHRCAEYAKKYENETEGEEVVLVEESSDESEAWDCETIISTYSNLDNHPGKIAAPEVARRKKISGTIAEALSGTTNMITLKGKEKLPVEFLPQARKFTAEKVKSGDSLKQEQHRRKHGQESKEEKKERKAAVKEERREARRMKKEMKGIYRCEAQRAQKVAAETGPASIPLA